MKKFNICLIGNPNVGKSTVFNCLTGLKQHTGNWTGKTVETAKGNFKIENYFFEIIDLPGTYSLEPKAKDENIACEYILKNNFDAIIIVVDANRLSRNLLLVLEIMRLKKNLILCVNFIDELNEQNILFDESKLKKILSVPVIQISAKKKFGLKKLKYEILKMCLGGYKNNRIINLPNQIESLYEIGDLIEKLVVKKNFNVRQKNFFYGWDKIILNKFFALPIMFLLLLIIFWLTIFGANYFSDWIAILFGKLEILLRKLFFWLGINKFLTGLFIDGMYRTLTWVVAVMLPPMAIFFPLFNILEDFGLLPRIAFNCDGIFKKFNCHGKQVLSMCMGFGCNAAGVVSCRTINSEREKSIAVLTNNFTPCNGRFPGLIILASMLINKNKKLFLLKIAVILSLIIIFSLCMTLISSKILARFFFKDRESFFVLELPPYRKPKILAIIIRSVFDKTFKILFRAVIVTIPSGILIWLLANLRFNSISFFNLLTNFLDPFGKLINLDGKILTAFFLGMPANEIIFPLIIMAYKNNLTLMPIENFKNITYILKSNGWTIKTILAMIIFYVNHFPCATTLLTIKKETGSIKYMILAFIFPTLLGFLLCYLINFFTF